MAVTYRHTQPGTVTIIALGLGAALVAVDALVLTLWPLWALAVALAVLAWLFSSLTVEVSENQVQWYFGPGIWKYRIALADVDSIDIVHNKCGTALVFGCGLASGSTTSPGLLPLSCA